MGNTKNDKAWQLIFDKHKILNSVLNEGRFEITAAKLNEFREARLMTKIDHRSQLPKLFADNNLSILPISRGGYVIGAFETFCDFNTDDVDESSIEFPTFLESIDI